MSDMQNTTQKTNKGKASKQRRCPNCRSKLSSVMLVCDCGYHFQTGTIIAIGDRPSVSRIGKLLRVTYHAEFPDYCVRCGQPSSRLSHQIFHSPGSGIPALDLVSSLAGIHGKMELNVPICDKCYSGRRWKLLIGAALSLALFPVAVLLDSLSGQDHEFTKFGFALYMFAILLIPVGVVLIWRNVHLLVVTEIDRNHKFGMFRGASPKFLSRIPHANE